MILTTNYKHHLAQHIIDSELMLAWGTGDENWQDDDFSTANQSAETALSAELGRRVLVIKTFALPDAGGEIQLPNGSYTATTEPSDIVYLKCLFEYDDEPTAVIREYGVFMNSKTNASLPVGQQYFSAADVVDAGLMISYSRLRTPLYRTADTRQAIEIIIPIMQVVE